ncbi:MAG: hypothetical protein ACRC0Y_09645 [Fusobacteriaceae bacterium]
MINNVKKMIIIFIFGIFFLSLSEKSYSWFKDEVAESVKNGKLSNYPQKTLGEAIDGFVGNAEWESIISDDGNSYVNITGIILFHEKEVEILIQYKVNKDDSFEFNALEFNEIPQNFLMYSGLLKKMYE